MTPRAQVLFGVLIAFGWVALEATVNQITTNPTGGLLLIATIGLCWVARAIFMVGRPR